MFSFKCYKISKVLDKLDSSLYYSVFLLLNSDSAARLLKASTWEASVGWKRKGCFRRPAVWAEGGLLSKNQLQRFCSTMKVFKGRIIWGGGQSLPHLPLCTFLLIVWWWGNQAVFQESCAQPEVTVLHLGRDLSSCRRTQRYFVMYIPWGGTRTLPHGCTIVSWLLLLCFCVPSLPWKATVWICPLELREGQGGWMKPISYKLETGDPERICT